MGLAEKGGRRDGLARLAGAAMALSIGSWTLASTGPAVPSPESVRVQPPSHCLSEDELRLAQLIDDYRAAHGLKPVPLSRSLTEVAKSHVFDLEENAPTRGADPRGQACSLHSWSGDGPWTAVCYTRDHANAKIMWSKPREVTGGLYAGNGFENAYWTSRVATPEAALAGWKRSPPHNALLLELNTWQGANWPAMGVAVSEHFAVVWFGDRPDAWGTVGRCETQRDRFLQSLLPLARDPGGNDVREDVAGAPPRRTP